MYQRRSVIDPCDELVFFPAEKLLHHSLRLFREIPALQRAADEGFRCQPMRRARVLVFASSPSSSSSVDQFALWYTNLHQDNHWNPAAAAADVLIHHQSPFNEPCKIRCISHKQNRSVESARVHSTNAALLKNSFGEEKFLGQQAPAPLVDEPLVFSTVFQDVESQIVNLRLDQDEKSGLIQEVCCSSRNNVFPMVDFILIYDMDWMLQHMQLFEWLVGYSDGVFALFSGVDLLEKSFDELMPVINRIPPEIAVSKLFLLWANMDQISEQDRLKVAIQCASRVETLKFANRKNLPICFPVMKDFGKETHSPYSESLEILKHEINTLVIETSCMDLSSLSEPLNDVDRQLTSKLNASREFTTDESQPAVQLIPLVMILIGLGFPVIVLILWLLGAFAGLLSSQNLAGGTVIISAGFVMLSDYVQQRPPMEERAGKNSEFNLEDEIIARKHLSMVKSFQQMANVFIAQSNQP
eukprot:TRINITY_DN7876_c0_g1_i5.p1 TRINITY_DN7876_c0_g1~~TRINITY_DN7876_c0_g1_i5.p1  ORF type:complete len:470 (+),score=111.82 TRINITY_DN7876_c0_g1_i5:104-1513(+)